MTTRTLESIDFTSTDEGWNGQRSFPHLARFVEAEDGERPELSEEDARELMQQAEAGLAEMKQKMGLPADFADQFAALAEKHGLLDDLDDDDDEPDEEIERQRELHRQGIFTIAILGDDDEEAEPSPEQRQALSYFTKNEQRICDRLLDAVLRYYEFQREQDPEWFALQQCPDIETVDDLVPLLQFQECVILREHADGTALTGFLFSCDWDIEHGFGVCMHEDVVVNAGSAESAYEVQELDESLFASVATPEEKKRLAHVAGLVEDQYAEREERYVPSDYDSLVMAIQDGDIATVERLTKAGVSINDCDDPRLHPIFGAIGECEVDGVRTMIRLGANLKVKNYEKQTPLAAAEEQLKGLRFMQEMTGMMGDLGRQIADDGSSPAALIERAEAVFAMLNSASQ